MLRGPRATTVFGRAIDEEAARKLALDMAKARRVMSSVAPDDHQTWAHVARETSGVLGAWWKATEAEPGPLARASRALARSAHRSGVTISTPVQAPLRMTGTAAFLMAATTAPSPVAQALIMQQVVRTIRLLRDMQRSNNDLREARALTDSVRQQLAIVAAPLPEVAEPQLPAPEGMTPKAVRPLNEAQPTIMVPPRVKLRQGHDQEMGR
ncbi:MAG: relaxase [Micrococcaceae bacterium]|jgi:hypothetical protein|nr:relaxase [Micrococcaceae bacterium]